MGGVYFLDIDECENNGTFYCDDNANCTNTFGAYICECNSGFTGDGSSCMGQLYFKHYIHSTLTDSQAVFYFQNRLQCSNKKMLLPNLTTSLITLFNYYIYFHN